MALDKTSSSVNTRTCLQTTLGRKCHLAPQADHKQYCDLFEIRTAFTVYLLQVGKQCVLYIMSCPYGFHIFLNYSCLLKVTILTKYQQTLSELILHLQYCC